MTPRPNSNSSGSNVGVAQLPGFDESLRLLVERERYTQTDIAMMFGVSRERMRQICDRRGFSLPDGAARGLRAVRVWDDMHNRFGPVSRGKIAKLRRSGATAQRKAGRAAKRADAQARIVSVVTGLQSRLLREPTWLEVWVALGGRPDVRHTSITARVLAMWDSRGGSSIAKLLEFRRATGTIGQKPGPRAVPHSPHSDTPRKP